MADVKITISADDESARRALRGLAKEAQKTGNVAESAFGRAGRALAGFGAQIAAAAGAFASFRAVSGAVNAFREFETGLVGVGKTTGIAGKQLDQFGKNIQALSKQIPVATSELLEISQAAGQLGVKGANNILIFTDTVAKLGRASDLSGAEAASALTTILNLSREPISDISRLASQIVSLGNNFNATESQIVAVATRVSQATTIFKVNSGAVVGISTALKALGVQAEAGGTVVGRAFQAISDSISGGGAQMRRLSELTGIAGADLKKTFQEDSAGVFQAFIEGLNKIPADQLKNELKGFGLEGVRVLSVLGALSQGSDTLARAMADQAREAQNVTALEREFAEASKTLDSQIQILNNSINVAAQLIGAKLAPIIASITGALNKFINFLTRNALIFEDFASALGLVVSAGAPFIAFLNSSKIAVLAIAAAQRVWNVAVAANPIGLLLNGLTILGTKLIEISGGFNGFIGIIKQMSADIIGLFLPGIQAMLKGLITVASAAGKDGLAADLAFARAELKQFTKELAESGEQQTFSALQARDAKQKELDAIVNGNKKIVDAEKQKNQDILNSNQEGNEQAKNLCDQKTEAIINCERSLRDRQLALDELDFVRAEEKALQEEIARGEQDEQKLEQLREFRERRRKLEAEQDEIDKSLDQTRRAEKVKQEAKDKKEIEKARRQKEKDEKNSIASIFKLDKEAAQNKKQLTLDTLNTIAQGTRSSNKTIFAIGKAASISIATIDGIVAVQKALASTPPPINIALAAAVGAVTAANIARISQTKPPSFQTGGILPGVISPRDTTLFQGAPGELVLNRRQQTELFNSINQGGLEPSGGGTTINVQGNVIADDDDQVNQLMERIRDQIEFRNAEGF